MKQKTTKQSSKKTAQKQPKQKKQLKTRTDKTASKKNASLGEIASKIAGVLTKPFKKDQPEEEEQPKKKRSPFQKKDPSKKRRLPGQKTDEEVQKQSKALEEDEEELQQDQSTNKDYSEAKAQAEHPASQFFYSDEKFVTAFEDKDITETIALTHPQFLASIGKDAMMKRAVIAILEDEEFMDGILKMYNMSIYDFFKYLYRVDSSIFRGNFISRIQDAMKRKPYAKVKLPEYKFRRVQRAMVAARKRNAKRKS